MGSLSQVTPAQLCPGTAQLVPSSAQAGEQDSPRQGSGFAHRVGSRGRAGHSLPGSALGGCDPAQPPTQLTQALSTQHWGTAPSGCMDTPQTSHPWHKSQPCYWIPSLDLHSLTWATPCGCWQCCLTSSTMPHSPLGCQRQIQEPSCLWWDLPELQRPFWPLVLLPTCTLMVWLSHTMREAAWEICRHRFSNRWLFAS